MVISMHIDQIEIAAKDGLNQVGCLLLQYVMCVMKNSSRSGENIPYLSPASVSEKCFLQLIRIERGIGRGVPMVK